MCTEIILCIYNYTSNTTTCYCGMDYTIAVIVQLRVPHDWHYVTRAVVC